MSRIKINTIIKIIRGIAFLLAIFLFMQVIIPINTAKAEKNSLQQLSESLSADIDKINEMVDYLDNTNDSSEAIISKMSGYKTHFEGSQALYSTLQNNLESNFQPVAKLGMDGSSTIINSIDEIVNGINATDQAKVQLGIDGFNKGVTTFNNALSLYNQHAASFDYGVLYIILAIFFGLISFYLFLSSRIKVTSASKQIMAEAKKSLFQGSLWPTIGAIVTAVWYYLTPPGGKYYILWGPMVIGFFYFVRQLDTYLRVVKPQIKLAAEFERKHSEEKQSEIIPQQEKQPQLLHNEVKCTNCGKILSQPVNYCTNCGAKIKEG